MNTSRPGRIAVIGASGGLGGALARHYARPGARLCLWGRDAARLADVARECRAAGAQATARRHDLADIPGAVAALIAEDTADPIGLALFASGIGDIRAAGDRVEDPAQVARLVNVNFAAPAALAAALAGAMAARGHGRIVLIGSAAGFHALPFAAGYAGSKAGLARFARALRIGVRQHGVTVTLVSPGFIDTAAGAKVPGHRPLLMAPEIVAARIARAAQAGTAHLIMPWPFAALRLIDRLLPAPLRDRLLLALAPPEGPERTG